MLSLSKIIHFLKKHGKHVSMTKKINRRNQEVIHNIFTALYVKHEPWAIIKSSDSELGQTIL